MNHTFNIFGVRNIQGLFNDTYQAADNAVKALDNTTVLSNQENINDLIDRISNSFKIKPLNLSFDKKDVRDIHMPINDGRNNKIILIIEIPIQGNSDLLKCSPNPRGAERTLPVEIQRSNLCYKVDTGFHDSINFPDPVKLRIKQSIEDIETYITNTLTLIDHLCNEFNNQLRENIAPLVEAKLREAKNYQQGKDFLKSL